MAQSAGQHSYGSDILTSTTSGGTYTSLAEVIDMGDDIELPVSNMSHLKSDSATKENKPKMIDPGTVTLKLNFTKAQYASLLGYIAARSQRYYKILTPNADIIGPWYGSVGKLGTAIPDDDRITNDVTFHRSGPLAFTPGP